MERTTARSPSRRRVLLALALAAAVGAPAHAVEVLPREKGSFERGVPLTDPAPYVDVGLIPGDWVVLGTVQEVRRDHTIVDIGNLQPLYLPRQPAREQGFDVKPGDVLKIVMNDHYAVVDYHPAGGERRHTILRGQMTVAPTVGMDKAVIKTPEGQRTVTVASRARAKLSVIPLDTEALFLLDETGRVIDAQITSAEGVRESAENEKPPIKGAHRRVQALFLGSPKRGQVTVKVLRDGSEHTLPLRPPIGKLEELKENQRVALLLDAEGYVTEIATPDVPVR